MIELSGGHEFVDRLVMAGPPNRGTLLANTGRGLLYLVTELINNYSGIPPLGLANWFVKEIYQQGAALADLAVDSEVLQKLNGLKEPGNVPYLVLAGKNIIDDQGHNRLNRRARKVMDKTLDALFGEQNDIAVGFSSMQAVRNGCYPKLSVEILNCDHFHYYFDSLGREAIKNWIKK